MSPTETEVRAQNLFNILGSIISIVRGDQCCLLMAHYQWTLKFVPIQDELQICLGLILASSNIFVDKRKFQPQESEYKVANNKQ